jgi:hypothetical protein
MIAASELVSEQTPSFSIRMIRAAKIEHLIDFSLAKLSSSLSSLGCCHFHVISDGVLNEMSSFSLDPLLDGKVGRMNRSTRTDDAPLFMNEFRHIFE